VDGQILTQSRAPSTDQEEAHRLLMDACREALAWFDRFARHAPAELEIGGEGRIRRRLREAVRLASFEIRPCLSCDGGMTRDPAAGPMERPRFVPCQECGGSGERRVFLYPKPKARRGV
jgi:hypothetical protein